MRSTTAEVLETAKALPREERAELTRELLATLDEQDVSDATRLEAIRAAIDKGIADLDAGSGIAIPPEGLRAYLRERGRLATERASRTA